MIKIMNNSSRSLGLPGSGAVLLKPGAVTEVADHRWDKAKTNPVVTRWLSLGVLAEAEKESAEHVEKIDVEVRHEGAGWYNVLVSGVVVNDKKLRKDEAQELASEYD